MQLFHYFIFLALSQQIAPLPEFWLESVEPRTVKSSAAHYVVRDVRVPIGAYVPDSCTALVITPSFLQTIARPFG